MVSDERYYDYMGRRMREEQEKLDVIKEEHTHTSGLMLDMKELTKCHYDVLIRNKELVEENEKLRKEILPNGVKVKVLHFDIVKRNAKFLFVCRCTIRAGSHQRLSS